MTLALFALCGLLVTQFLVALDKGLPKLTAFFGVELALFVYLLEVLF